MGNVGLQNPSRQMGGNVSFAQSLGGVQTPTPLDLSEFPSLSNSAQLPSGNSGSMWATTGTRNLSGPVRNQQTPLSSQAGQDDLFSAQPSRMASGHGSFRYGNQGAAPPAPGQPQNSEEFPPLNRNGTGEIGSERMGFGPQNGVPGPMQANRGNGLLNALSATSRANDARSPPGGTRPQELDDAPDQTPGDKSSNGPRTSGNATSASKSKEDKATQPPKSVDPLEGMPQDDRYGLKGLRTLMNNFPDFHATVVGIDPVTLGLDLTSQEPISTQVYSLYDDAPPRPTVNGNRFRLPDCYNVTNVQPIDTKIQNFNEETLFWIFYSSPNDIKQHLAAAELHSRNWRWHKKHQVWLTKDEHMTPQMLGPTHERGYYIVWDPTAWRKDRREFTLYYSDLDTTLSQPPVGT